MAWRPAYRPLVPERLLDAEQLVVLRDAIGAAGRSGFDLSGIGRNGEVGNRHVFGLAGPVRDDACVARLARHGHRLERFRHGADLIHLHEQCVSYPFGNTALEDFWIRDEHIVADELNLVANLLRQQLQPVPIALATPSSIEMMGVLPRPIGSIATISSMLRSGSPDF